MVVSPKKVLETLQAYEEDEIERLEGELDIALDGTRLAVNAKLLGSSKRVRDRMVKMYAAAGWVINFQSDQRDGDFYWFSHGE